MKKEVIDQNIEIKETDSKINKNDNIEKAILYNKEFELIKVYPRNRLFNSFLVVFLFVSFIFLGIIIGCLVIIFG
ncbi:hypothetical protein [Malacoplasma iowae]|uniref:Uncharacterized protein n=1 Tax=Malacoplasma iowae 695 TaxID=1048830 RepID=A0A6P1LCB5_MALIO|nr:hypothetical protein [Malacoplasma iowae]VEU61950.1 Uncharacterised protein [Mycoplasmopsis fermentans]EGZ31115.1 hypothetical protein GUU_03656 [Malacoplasma iowae 695]QHG90046.1 hypothetical protein EER00_04110 [Malacoplasma iowae 695]WPL36223.1 hypothetical protein QX180_02265 [Malacoplasma iowae]VEU70777.1 Uncharacterised protein [Malacoplasma iowae]